MSGLAAVAERFDVGIAIGGMPIRIRLDDADFLRLLQERYAGFVTSGSGAQFEFEIDLAPPGLISPDDDVRVRLEGGRWFLDRGDFHAEWNASSATGRIRQTANPYSIDAVLRIVHTILLAKEGGFLIHAASAVRNGRAFIFSGVSGSGKTTLSRLAPKDATLLTDEISYVRKQPDGYVAYGTPFTGELAKLGENIQAPLAALYLLKQGPENRIDRVSSTEAIQGLMANILFFAEDTDLVRQVFDAACEFTSRVPVYRLTFLPDTRVWEMIV